MYRFRKKINYILAFLLDAFLRLLSMARGPSRPTGRHNESNVAWLWVRLDHLGDVFLATAAAKAIKAHDPSHRVVFLVATQSAALLQNNPYIDEIWCLDAPWHFAGGWRKFLSNLKAVYKKMELSNICTVFLPRGDVRENILFGFLRHYQSYGYGVTGGGILLSHRVEYANGVHESRHSQDLLSAAGVLVRTFEPGVFFANGEEKALGRNTEWLGLNPGEPYGVFLIEAGTRAKEWPRELIDAWLLQAHKIKFSGKWVLAAKDASRWKNLIEFVNEKKLDRVVNAIGKLSFRELLFLLKNAEVCVGFDSGPTHIAAWSGPKTLFLFSGTNSLNEWGSLSPKAMHIQKQVPCIQCALRHCQVTDHPCMSQIRPEEVVAALSRALED